MSESAVPGLCERVLFCTDFSPNADFAFELAVDAVRRRQGCMLYLLHVIPEPDSAFWRTYIDDVEDASAKARADIDARIAASYSSKIPDGVPFEVHIAIGKDYQEILKFARSRDVNLIVLGRQGHSAVGDLFFFGGVSEKVVRKSHCAVLVVPMSMKTKTAGGR